MEEQSIDAKREQIISFLKNKNSYIYILILIGIIWYSSAVRVSNLPLLVDATTGDYTTADPDASLYLRYSREIVENGQLDDVDKFRYYPKGLPTREANPIIPYTIAWLYKVFHVFNPSITIALADVALYPIFFFILGSISFYFLVARLFNRKVALLATFILAILPPYLFRTLTGVGDKEVFGMFFLYLALYLYLLALGSSSNKKVIIFGVLAGLSTGILNLAWNGANFVFLLIGLNTLMDIFLDRFSRKEIYAHGSWIIVTTLLLLMFKYGLSGVPQIVFYSITTALAYFGLFVGIFMEILHLDRFKHLKEKIISRLPLGIAAMLATFLLGLIVTAIFISPGFLFSKIASIFDSLIHPFGLGRLTLTVAESYQPYFTDWISNFSMSFLFLFYIASIYLFYNMVKPLKNLNWKLTILYSLFILAFVLSRYSSGSQVFNGETATANIFYIGPLIIFALTFAVIYLYSYYKKNEIYHELTKLDKKSVFIFIWMLLLVVGARGAIRLFFTLAPIMSILAAYIIVEAFEKLFRLKDKVYKYVIIIVIAFLLLSPFPFYNGILVKFAKITSNSAKNTGPAYNQQWQYAMAWVRDNTPENSVFAHWWDYGYWVQTGANRPTILDGGNHIAYWDTLMGRYVLTGQTEDEALEFLKTHDASYLLIDPSDVGKYPAYSSIGSDENFDRLSYIPVFTVDPRYIQETRNETVFIYQGQFAFDEDFIYNGKLYPKNSAGIIGFKVPVVFNGNDISIRQPTAFVAYNDPNPLELTVECVNVNNEIINFQNSVLKGCLKLIPTISGNNVFNNNLNFPAAALYISERSRRALWVKLYLLEQQSSSFTLAYSDEGSIPLALFQGQLIGPLKIWQISYPAHIQPRPQYLNTTGPEFL